jgi:hypothetical protein
VRKRKKRASLTKEERQAINKQKTEAGRKKRAKMAEEQKAEKRRQRNAYWRNKKVNMGALSSKKDAVVWGVTAIIIPSLGRSKSH